MNGDQTLSKIEKRRIVGGAPAAPPIAHINHSVIEIDTKEIKFSPFNRTSAREPDPDLIEDVKRRGILEPVLVRYVDGDFELVFGERRVRAALAAKLALVPAFKADMTDEEVVETQIAENMKRRDLHPLDEAEAFAILRDRFGHDADSIGAKCGKSRSYVFQRMKLLDLTPKAREAFIKGEINASVALYVARIPTEKVQIEALKELERSASDGEGVSARRAFQIIESRYMLKLADAPFSTTDAALTAAGACSACPKRTGNQRELFADVSSADVCTDPTCFAEKKVAGWKVRVTEAKAKDQAVIPTDKAFPQHRYGNLSDEFIDLKTRNYSDPKQRTWGTLLKGDMPEVAITRDKDGEVHELVKASTARAALVKIGHAFAKPEPRKPTTKPTSKPADVFDEKIEELATTMTIEAVVAKAETKEPNAEWWRKAIDVFEGSAYSDLRALLARRGIDNDKGAPEHFKAVEKLIASLNAAKLRGLFVELLCGPGEGHTGELAAFAKIYGVDVKAIEKRARESITKATGVPVADLKKMPARDQKQIAKAAKGLTKKKAKK